MRKRFGLSSGVKEEKATQTVRDVTYQLLRELELTTFFGERSQILTGSARYGQKDELYDSNFRPEVGRHGRSRRGP